MKLVDLTALINEKLQSKTEKTQPVVPVIKKEAPKVEEKKEEPKVIAEEKKEESKILAEEESHKIMTPFIDKIKEKHIDEEPEKVIESFDKAQDDNSFTIIQDDKKVEEKPVIEKTTPPVTQQNQNTNEPPKTFTEWLSTLKK